MKLELNYYKKSGKWYTTETVEIEDDSLFDFFPANYPNMLCQVNIIETDGHIQPYRIFNT